MKSQAVGFFLFRSAIILAMTVLPVALSRSSHLPPRSDSTIAKSRPMTHGRRRLLKNTSAD